MNKTEFNATTKRLGFQNQEQVANALGVTLRTVNGYANGQAIPEPVARLLRLMLDYQNLSSTTRNVA